MKRYWKSIAIIIFSGILGSSSAMAQPGSEETAPGHPGTIQFPEYNPLVPPYSYTCTVYQNCLGGPGGEISVGPVQGTCQVTATGVVIPPFVCPPPSTYNGGIVTPFHQYQLGLPPVLIGIYDVSFGPGGIPIATRR